MGGCGVGLQISYKLVTREAEISSTKGGLTLWHSKSRSIRNLALQEVKVGGILWKMIPLRSFQMLQADSMKISMNNDECQRSFPPWRSCNLFPLSGQEIPSAVQQRCLKGQMKKRANEEKVSSRICWFRC